MQQLILIIHVLVAICLIGLVLVQHGKGADAGAAFGSGSSNTMFGSQGSLPFLIKVTGLLAAIFFGTSIALSYFSMPHPTATASSQDSLTQTVPMTTDVSPPLNPSGPSSSNTSK